MVSSSPTQAPDSVVIVCHYCPTTVSGGVAFHRHLVGHSLTA